MTKESQPLRVLLIGSTGPMGRAVLTHADPLAIEVRAFARQPEVLERNWQDVVQGDVRDRESLIDALDGIDAVICTLGGKPWHRDSKHVHEVGTENLISAMHERHCKRLIAVTGIGAGSSRGHGPFYYDWFARPTVLRAVYADKERQEALIEGSNLSWTIVRPSILVPKTPKKAIRAQGKLARTEKMGPISRDDVAQFLLNEVANPAHMNQIVHLYT